MELTKIQLVLLQNASAAVKKSGTLVYATCSVFVPENMGIVNKFLETNKDFSLKPFSNPLSGKMTNGTLHIYPWDADSDAMFVVKLIRN
jgi:16S rRNA (cytosine967-C5)-methyltransferase